MPGKIWNKPVLALQIYLILTSVGVGRDDLVILPSLLPASANTVSHCGAKPWFFDVTEESWTINVDQVRNVLETEVGKQNASIHKPTGKNRSNYNCLYIRASS